MAAALDAFEVHMGSTGNTTKPNCALEGLDLPLDDSDIMSLGVENCLPGVKSFGESHVPPKLWPFDPDPEPGLRH